MTHPRGAFVVLSFTLLASRALSQNLLVNGSFEAPSAGSTFVTRSGDFGPAGGWSINGAIDHIGGFWAAAGGTQSVDLNGATAGSVSQTFPTTPGKFLLLQFALSENFFGYDNKTMDVLWNGTVIDHVTVIHDPERTPTNVKWIYRSRRILASSPSSTLTFLSTTGAMNGVQGVATYYGPAIDDVSVVLSDTCAGDLNGDQQVDDSDFVLFVNAYNILDCADPTMTLGCPADLNLDGVVDDADFTIFVIAYNALLCP
ncbi:MAG: DUF642 domain-containing protein [Phycisphaerales bacterium]